MKKAFEFKDSRQDNTKYALSKTAGSVTSFLAKIGNFWKEEQKNLLFNKKSRQEEKDYFNLMKFFFSSPQ